MSTEFKNHICRVCLDENVVLNWNNHLLDYYGITYKDCYYKYTQLEYLAEDPFSPMLCQNCLNGLQNIHTLIMRALESHKYYEQTQFFQIHSIDGSTNTEDNIKYSQTAKFETVLIDPIEEVDLKKEHCEDEKPNKKCIVKNREVIIKSENKSLKCENIKKSKTKQRTSETYTTKEGKSDVECEEAPVLKTEDSEDTLLLFGSSKKSKRIDNTKRKSTRQNKKVKNDSKVFKTEVKMRKSENELLGDNCSTQMNSEDANENKEKELEDCVTHKTKRKVYKEEPKMCSICSRILNSRNALREHEETHIENRERKETCEICGLKYYNKRTLKYHMQTHSENRKKHNCEFCDKTFCYKGALNIHRRVHLGQMVPCTLCSKQFFRQIDLERHMNSHSATTLNSDTKKRTRYFVRCQHCGKSVLSTNFKVHTAVHLKEPLMECTICNKGFYLRKNCVNHVKKVHQNSNCNDFIRKFPKSRISRLFLEQKSEIVTEGEL